MAFTDAVFDGDVELEGIKAVRVDALAPLRDSLAARDVIPVVVGDVMKILAEMKPDILIDARVRKRALPEIQRGLAPLTIGLGPNFVAGSTTDIAVETSWEDLGRVITAGAPLPFRGEPREIAGHARARYVYASERVSFGPRIESATTCEPANPSRRLRRRYSRPRLTAFFAVSPATGCRSLKGQR